MPNHAIDHPMDNVIDIFTRKPISELSDNKIIRIAPELDGLAMLKIPISYFRLVF
jgi:hypothetical protein